MKKYLILTTGQTETAKYAVQRLLAQKPEDPVLKETKAKLQKQNCSVSKFVNGFALTDEQFTCLHKAVSDLLKAEQDMSDMARIPKTILDRMELG